MITENAQREPSERTDGGSEGIQKKTSFVTLLIYLAFGLYITFPLISAVDASVLIKVGQGDFKDWVLESAWMEQMLRTLSLMDRGHAPVRIQYLNITDLLIDLPFRLLFPFPLHYNLTALTILVLDAFCGFLLLFYLTRNYYLSLALGGVLAWNPIAIRELHDGRPHLVAVFFFYLFLLYLYKLKNEAAASNSVWAAVFLVLNCMTFWYYGFGAFFTLVVFVLCHLSPASSRVAFLKRVGWMLAISAAGIAILALGGRGYVSGDEHVRWFQAFPDVRHNAEGGPGKIVGMSQEWSFVWVKYRTLLLATLALFAATIAARIALRRRVDRQDHAPMESASPLFLGLTFVLFYLLNLGPVLKDHARLVTVDDHLVLLPYRYLYHYLPYFSRLHEPERLEVFALVPLVLTVGYYSSRLVQLVGRTKIVRFALQALCLCLLVVPLFSGNRQFTVEQFADMYPFDNKIESRREGRPSLLALPCTGEAGDDNDKTRVRCYWEEYFLIFTYWKRNVELSIFRWDQEGACSEWMTCRPRVSVPDNPRSASLFEPETLAGFDFVLLATPPALEHVKRDLPRQLREEYLRKYETLARIFGAPLVAGPNCALFRVAGMD